jgi:hypothetical protein
VLGPHPDGNDLWVRVLHEPVRDLLSELFLNV